VTTDVGYGESLAFENGGMTSRVSQGYAKRFDFAFDLENSSLLNVFRSFRRGSFGTSLLRFADPFCYRTNLFAPAWAEPGLIEGGDWPSIFDTAPTFAAVSANSYGQPIRKATFTITAGANVAPTRDRSRFIIPIPADMTLHLGVSGSATGTGVVHVEAHNIAAGSSTGSNLTLLTDTGSTRLNASFAGSAYDYVAVDLRRTSGAASTVTVTSMLAQLWKTTATPVLTGNHVPGDGHTGLWFLDGNMTGAHRLWLGEERFSSLGFSLVEVGAWR
jgi:hypothetical protein